MIKKDIQDAISKNLPEATATYLEKYISDSESLKVRIKDITELSDTLRRELNDKNALISRHDSLDAFEVKLKNKEIELNDKERGIDLHTAKIKLEETTNCHIKIMQLVETVFGHPSVTISNNSTRQIMKNENEYNDRDTQTLYDSNTTTTAQGKEKPSKTWQFATTTMVSVS